MSDTIDTYAQQAEEALERLARAGWNAGREPVSEGLYRTIRDLAAATRYLTEIPDHLSNGLQARAELGRLRLDYHGDARYPTPDTAIAAAQMALAEATQAARALATAIDEAQQITATIADSGNLPQGTCRCGHDHADHDGEQGEGRCLVARVDPASDDWIDCDCGRYQPAEPDPDAPEPR